MPVDWTDDPDSRVHILATACADLRGIWHLGSALARGCVPLPARAASGRPSPLGRQVVTFLLIGAASTLAYLLLCLALQDITTARLTSAAHGWTARRVSARHLRLRRICNLLRR